jgi:hypothetical protein
MNDLGSHSRTLTQPSISILGPPWRAPGRQADRLCISGGGSSSDWLDTSVGMFAPPSGDDAAEYEPFLAGIGGIRISSP